ncbi:MAG: tRNA (guanosine(46)-N7)-methyltransferase TrmB [Bacteroidetes bacterium]|nr:MAG: tRNA (guanosine(46)-N7)-methyltransferase TrmB [Bacteroidota bacterium]
MARKKLERFAENKAMHHVIEPKREEVLKGLDLQGNWGEKIFGNDKPIVLELGCGKGEYTLAMAQRFPEKNFIGIDIKGSRIWYGATEAKEKGLDNVAFLRTQIELIDNCFDAGEIAEIWITFPDPQLKHTRIKHRLTHPNFLMRYQSILEMGGLIHLKTDSEFLHGYTLGLLQLMGFPIHKVMHDIDKQLKKGEESLLQEVKTYYEEKFRNEGKKITYIRFSFA